MEDPTIPSSLIGAIVFFLLLGILAFVVIRETVKIVLKPALVVAGLAMVAVWAGVLDETIVGRGFRWIGDEIVAGVDGISEWVAGSWEERAGAE